MSAQQYTRITADEFDSFMTELVPNATKINIPGTREDVWELPLPSDDHTIRVYSTIQGTCSRERGTDAIRCVVWNNTYDEPVGGRRKTLRISTWRKNLRAKIEDLYAHWRNFEHGACPRCDNGVLVERIPSDSQQWNAFLSCSEWNGGDGCNYTKEL